MPIFEHSYRGDIATPDGKKVKAPRGFILQQVGPFLQVTISQTKQHIEAVTRKGETIVSPISGLALIDTGASSTAVDESVCKKLGLSPTGQMTTAHAGGSEVRPCYPIQIIFPGTPLPAVTSARAMSVNLQFGKSPLVLLFGRDLLSKNADIQRLRRANRACLLSAVVLGLAIRVRARSSDFDGGATGLGS